MEDITEIIPPLIEVAERSENKSSLFSFQLNGLSVRGIFFSASRTLTIGISDRSIAWQCDISDGKLSEKIPREAYEVVGDALVNNEGKRSNKPFFLKLSETLSTLSIAEPPTDIDILDLLKNCNTKDKHYDKEGHKPFFDHWRRVKPSSESLRKIQRYFGKAVREECYQNQVTAVWSPTPKQTSLIFLNPVIAIDEIKRA